MISVTLGSFSNPRARAASANDQQLGVLGGEIALHLGASRGAVRRVQSVNQLFKLSAGEALTQPGLAAAVAVLAAVPVLAGAASLVAAELVQAPFSVITGAVIATFSGEAWARRVLPELVERACSGSRRWRRRLLPRAGSLANDGTA